MNELLNSQRQQNDLPFVAGKSKSLAKCSSREARDYLEYRQALKYKALPLAIINNKKALRLAVADSLIPELKEKLRFATGLEVELLEIEERLLEAAINFAYKTDDIWLDKNLQGLKEINCQPLKQIKIQEDLEETEAVPKALRVIIEYAIAREASDIHLIPTVTGLLFKLRIKGELYSYKENIADTHVASRLISRIKILSNLRTDLRNLPQDGSFSIKLENTVRQIRVSTMPTVNGEKCVMRVSSQAECYNLAELGLSVNSLQILRECLNQKSGLLLCCGSTGSGKTTTLYAMVQELTKKNLNIITIEDPVEAQIQGVSQTSLDLQKGLDYSTALKAVLRQDPDVILVGEIRDSSSAELVLSAALSGHLVLSTIHASSVLDCILRLEDFNCKPSVLSSCLKLVLNQELVQKLCQQCKVVDLVLSNQAGFKLYKNVGCASCDYSGFDSRLLAVERLHFDSQQVYGQIKSKNLKIFKNSVIYESKNTYLDNYLRQGLILSTR